MTQIKSIKIGGDELKHNSCSCRDVRIYDKTFDIWTNKNVFGDSPLSFNEIKILKEVNKANSLEFTKDNDTNENLLIIETDTHTVVVVGRGDKK